MFEILSDKLGNVFRALSSKGRLTEKDIDDGLRQVRLALLEADVNFKVVKDFVDRVRERASGRPLWPCLSGCRAAARRPPLPSWRSI
jgi:signal recognition particle subunit SRP54